MDGCRHTKVANANVNACHAGASSRAAVAAADVPAGRCTAIMQSVQGPNRIRSATAPLLPSLERKAVRVQLTP